MSSALELLSSLRATKRDRKVSASEPLMKALAWARVSTEKQERDGASIPEQLREIRAFADKHGIEILEEYHEAASAFQHQKKRVEFHRMLERARSDRNVNIILVHDLARFGRDSGLAKMQLDELRRFGRSSDVPE